MHSYSCAQKNVVVQKSIIQLSLLCLRVGRGRENCNIRIRAKSVL
jgi:hypothetical protein